MNQWTVVKGDKEVQFRAPFSSILEKIEENQDPKKDAIVPVNSTTPAISYKQLQESIRKSISFYKKHLDPQDSIALLMENKPELLILSWGAWSANYRTVPLDSKRDTLERKIYKLKVTNTKILFVRTDQVDVHELNKIKLELPQLTIMRLDDDYSFFELIEQEQQYDGSLPDSFENDCLILFTSGTTGDPKGARLTPKSLSAGALQIQDWLKITRDDRFHILLPLHHINSTTLSLATILASGTIVLSRKYSKSKFWQITADYNVTITSIVPTIAYDLLSEEENFKNYVPKKLSRIQLGSAPVQPSVVLEFYRKYKIPLVQGFGSTETSLRCTGTPYPLKEQEYLTVVESNSIGEELSWNNVYILNNDGEEVSENIEGNICVRGPNVMQGYINQKDAFSFGWFNMGDVGYYKIENGRKKLFLNGRKKEIIIKGGSNISPLAIENALLENYDLDFCYAFGFPHARLGEEIAIVCQGNDCTRLQGDITNRRVTCLSPDEVPKVIISIDRDSLPKTSTGKIQRSLIKQQFGDQARVENLTIATTSEIIFRLIDSTEIELLQEATRIHNSRWPDALSTSFDKMKSKARNGFIIGAFKGEKLIGTISGLLVKRKDIENEEPYTQTWSGITHNGTFTNNDRTSDCVVCTAITIKSSKPKENAPEDVVELSPEEALKHIREDPVMKFHQKNKAGLEGGNIIQIIPHGRKEDTQSLGYNVLLEYNVTKEPVITHTASFGTQLLEAALLYAHMLGRKSVIAYSRPSSLYRHV